MPRLSTTQASIPSPSFRVPTIAHFLCRTAALALALLLTSGPQVLAEGSRELMDYELAQGGAARYAMQGNDNFALGRPGWVIFEVYLQAGETLHMGSNTIHTDGGNIYLWAPGTDLFNSVYPSAEFASALVDCVAQAAGDTNVGLIDTRAKEIAGPEVTPGDGGYESCQYTAAVSGLHPLLFSAVDETLGNASNMPAAGPAIGTQLSNGIHAWDATVRSAGGVDQEGRLMSRWLTFYENGSGGPDQQLYVLTRDGQQYRLSIDELDGLGFFMLSNNKGIQDRATGAPTYRSWVNADIDDAGDAQLYHFPEMPDDASNATHRLLVNPPDPLAVTGSGGLGEVLGYSDGPQALAAPSNLRFDGTASGGGISFAPNGFTDGTFLFDSPPVLDGLTYELVVDTDRNGSFDDAVDRRFGGIFDSAGNSVFFDGDDAAGNPLTFDQTYDMRLVANGGEVHFPMADIENLNGGIQIERLTSVASGEVFKAAYDDFNGVALTNTVPVSLLEGGDSSAPGFHTWTGNSGNNDIIDTWAFVPVTGPVLGQFVLGGLALGPAPTLSKSFAPTTIATGATSTLTFVIDNSANSLLAGNLAFSDPFPAGMVVADPSGAVTDCIGGTLTAVAGSASVNYSGGAVAGNSLCTIQVDVTLVTQGAYTNVTSALTSDFGSSVPATAGIQSQAVLEIPTVDEVGMLAMLLLLALSGVLLLQWRLHG